MAKPADQITWKDILPGAVILEAGSAAEYKTGDWRSSRPIIDLAKCKKCGTCWLFCPEPAIERQADKTPKVNLDYCKGCGICSVECPYEAISMKEDD